MESRQKVTSTNKIPALSEFTSDEQEGYTTQKTIVIQPVLRVVFMRTSECTWEEALDSSKKVREGLEESRLGDPSPLHPFLSELLFCYGSGSQTLCPAPLCCRNQSE